MNYYPTDLTDKQWQVIKNMLEIKEKKRKHFLRDIINAMMYLTKTGCQWRMLPKDFDPWQTVYFYFRKWKFEGIFEELMRILRGVNYSSFFLLLNRLRIMVNELYHRHRNCGLHPKKQFLALRYYTRQAN